MKCPVCNSKRLRVNPSFGQKCMRCGYEHQLRIKVNSEIRRGMSVWPLNLKEKV